MVLESVGDAMAHRTGIFATLFEVQLLKLREKASELFSQKSDLLCCDKPLKNTVANQYSITTSREWASFVEGANQESTEQFCLIKKRHSWSRLLISEELFLSLISYYSIFPSFLQTISFFGAQISEEDRQVGFFFQPQTRLPTCDGGSQNLAVDGYEIHYVLRYVEKHGLDLSNPWSMRKMAICHKLATEGNLSSWIIVHGSKTVQDSLTAPRAESISSLNGRDALEASAAANHLLILLDALRNWDDYIEYLSEEFKDTNDRALVSKIVKATDDQDLEVTIKDMQWLQGFIQHLTLVYASLSQNLNTVNGLCKFAKTQQGRTRRRRRQSCSSSQETELLTCIEFWRSHLKSTMQTLRTLKAQANACSQLIYNILRIKDNEILQLHGQMLNNMTETSRDDDRLIVALTEKSQKTARSMQTLTFLTLLYLPPSFLATLFGMNFFVVSNNGGARRIEIVPDAWMYLALAIPLTALTVGIWAIWHRKRSKSPSLTT